MGYLYGELRSKRLLAHPDMSHQRVFDYQANASDLSRLVSRGAGVCSQVVIKSMDTLQRPASSPWINQWGWTHTD